LDTALSTGDSGYLTRQLIYSTATIELDETEAGEDCGTTDGMEIEIKNKSMIKALLGRCYIKEDGRKKRLANSDGSNGLKKSNVTGKGLSF
jgi:DNA-directed RNA polymerase beta' subunit